MPSVAGWTANPADFWRRWHISLSTWFRDYVYLPLGGNRVSPLRRACNVLITFTLSGLWHGAAWTFVLWGVFHGLLVALPHWRTTERLEWPLGRRPTPRVRDVAAMIATFHAVCLGWVFFRASTVRDAFVVIERATSALVREPMPEGVIEPLLWGVPLLLLVEWLQRGRQHGFELPHATWGVRLAIAVACVIAISTLGPIETVPFIYFQF